MTPSLPEGVATFLFTDIEGSTRLAHSLGEDWFGVLQDHHRVLRAVFPDYDGVEVSTAGDSFFVVFADAARAVAASIAMQRAIAAHDWSPHAPIKVRMGLHTGPATLHDGHDYAGLTVHAASRVESAASGEQVLISEATLDAAGLPLPDGIDVLDLGFHRLKDLPAEVHIFQLLAAGLARDFPPVRGLDVLRNNVPVPASTFVGRADQLARLHEQLDQHRLVTLVGPGGSGKTRLALKLANERLHRYSGGVWFVELDPASDDVTTIGVFADVLGVREEPGRSLLDAVVAYVSDLDVLFVVDNTEHVIDAAARAVEAILRAGPQVRVLATSREPLAIAGERLWPVPPLSMDTDDPRESEAVHLLAARIELVQPDFVLDDASASIALSIARDLDGLPLALELAAASAAMLPLEEVARQLSDRFALLTGGSRTALDRQKTLWGAIDWSYELLDDAQRLLFRQLGVFPSKFDFDAAAGVCEGSDVPSGVSTLATKSLVTATPTGRFYLFESIRAYARERLAEHDETRVLAERHARWFAEGLLAEKDAPAWAQDVPSYESVWDDLNVALEWTETHDAPVALSLLSKMAEFWNRRGRWSEGRRVGERVLAATPSIGGLERAGAIGAIVGLAMAQGDSDAAEELVEEAVAAAREAGDDLAEFGRGDFGLIAAHHGDLELAETLLTGAVPAAKKLGPVAQATVLAHLAEIARRRGDLDLAGERVSHVADILGEGGNARLDLGLVTLMGTIAQERGDVAAARTFYRQAVETSRAIGDSEQLPYLLFCEATLALDENDHPTHLLHEAVTLGHDLDARADLAESLEAVARLAVRTDRELAANLLAAVDALRDQLEFPRAPADVPRYDDLRSQLPDPPAAPPDLEGAIAMALSLLEPSQ